MEAAMEDERAGAVGSSSSVGPDDHLELTQGERREVEARAAAVVLGYAAQAEVAAIGRVASIAEQATELREGIAREAQMELGSEIVAGVEKRLRKIKVGTLLDAWCRLANVEMGCCDRVLRSTAGLMGRAGLGGRNDRRAKPAMAGAGEAGAKRGEGLSRQALERMRSVQVQAQEMGVEVPGGEAK